MHGDVKSTLGKNDIVSKGKEMGKTTLFSYKKNMRRDSRLKKIFHARHGFMQKWEKTFKLSKVE